MTSIPLKHTPLGGTLWGNIATSKTCDENDWVDKVVKWDWSWLAESLRWWYTSTLSTRTDSLMQGLVGWKIGVQMSSLVAKSLIYTLCLCMVWYLSYRSDLLIECVQFYLVICMYVWRKKSKRFSIFFLFFFFFFKDFVGISSANSHETTLIH